MAALLKARTWELSALQIGGRRNALPLPSLELRNCTEGGAWESAKSEGLPSCSEGFQRLSELSL